MKYFLSLILLTTVLLAQIKVINGVDILLKEKFYLIENKNIGIIANHTSVLSGGEHLVDFLFSTKKVSIKAVFGPEHGFRGDAPDGIKIESDTDKATGIPVISLYGKINKPTPDMLRDIDILIFDIQDIGARFYTYISTLSKCLEAAAENNIKIIVCDRPNPINGLITDGPVLKPELRSFVGLHPIPVQHGMTIGELATMFNDEGWLEKGVRADLNVIKIKNWDRSKYYDELGLKWINPSPNMVSVDAAIVYPGMCFLEGTNISEGRGTYTPFLKFGAPFIEPEILAEKLYQSGMKGFKLEPVVFTPVSIQGMTSSPKYQNTECKGLTIKITNRNIFEPVKFGIFLVHLLNKLYPEKFQFRESSFKRLTGDDRILEMIKSGQEPEKIFQYWKPELNNFNKLREKYLLY